ncbi:GNAT family N-acetyltransferase [Ralstonia sp. 24A2]|uniref:GNAT family N-acetyltransferase n=1 Tax=Ralstonia sp. 24A2 TaxID=3447364 RepID=UPI003F69C496
MNVLLPRHPARIRAFHPGDEPLLRAVFYSAVHGLAAARYRREQLEAWAPTDYDVVAWADHIRRNQPFVAEIGGQPAGYTDLQADGYIDHFFVSAAHARQGIGQQLMDHILGLATQRGLSRMHSHVSLSAEPFFARNGFAVIARQTVTVRGVPLANALMVRMLG